MQKPEQKNKEQDIKEIEQQLDQFLKENKVKLAPGLSFPIYNKLPVELELALAVVQKHEPQFLVNLVPEKEVNDSQNSK